MNYFDNADFLARALKAMSQCEEHGTMSGHVPAACMATWFFCNEQELSDEVQKGTEQLLQRLIDGEHVFGGVKFTEIEAAPSGNASCDEIIQALADSMFPLKESGHNTIFAALALRAIAQRSVDQSIITGIARYMNCFKNTGPGWAHVSGQKELADPRSFLVDSSFELTDYTNVDEMLHAVCTYVVPVHFNRAGVGGSVHLIDHAVAIYDLQEMGHDDLVQLGLKAHHEHLCMWMSLPTYTEEERARPQASEILPLEDAYWQQEIKVGGGGLEHNLKILYGAYRFNKLIKSDNDRQQFQETMRYLF